MSIFDPGSGMNPLPWLQEKSLRALEEAARLVDLANEKDTSPWYSKELKQRASALIGRLAPLVSMFHGAREAAGVEEWAGIAERGTFALAAWCKKHDILDPSTGFFDLLARNAEEEEEEEELGEAKGQRGPELERTEDLDEFRLLHRRCYLYDGFARRLLRDDLPAPARKMLLWALSNLSLSEDPDVVTLSRRFLPTDIGVTPQEAVDAYRWLVEHGLFEHVNRAAPTEDALQLRLVVEGVNESKEPLPAEEGISFGFPGARVAGKPTIGNILLVPLTASHLRALASWRFTDEDRRALATALQEQLGADRAYVEDVSVKTEEPPALVVRLRYPLGQDDTAMTAALETAALSWMRTRIAPSPS